MSMFWPAKLSRAVTVLNVGLLTLMLEITRKSRRLPTVGDVELICVESGPALSVALTHAPDAMADRSAARSEKSKEAWGDGDGERGASAFDEAAIDAAATLATAPALGTPIAYATDVFPTPPAANCGTTR